MSAATTGPLPVRDIMSSGNASLSPKKRSGFNKLSGLLKSASSPNSPSRSPPPITAPTVPPSGVTGVQVSQWSLTRPATANEDTHKSKEHKIEVVVGTSPIRTTGAAKVREFANGSSEARQSPAEASISSSATATTTSTPTSPPQNTRQQHTLKSAMKSPTSPSQPLRPVMGSRNESPPPPGSSSDEDQPSGLQRSASDIHLVDLRGRSGTGSSQASGRPSIRSAVSETGLVMMNGSTVLERPQAAASLSKETKISRRQSITNRLRGRPRPEAIPTEPVPAITQLPRAMLSPREQVDDPMDERGSGLTKVARRTSWIIGSRSPSPSTKKLKQKKSIESRPSSSKGEPQTNGAATTPLAKSLSSTDVSQLDAAETPTKKNRRPLSAIITRSSSFAASSKPRIHLPKSLSTERLPSSPLVDEVPEMPKSIPKSKISMPETPRKKDELWSTFRSLDSDFHKFSSKPSSLKAQAVRTALLPFLKNTLDHPSTKTIRADDLDKRINVLNKWWVGLLEMLNGRNGQSVSPNDRPAVLDGVAGIMTRPEWRLTLAAIAPRTPLRPVVSRSASSLSSASSDFLAESVIHNVRNIFVQNLLSQMAFVIERMSMRNVPASIVNFCGKASAYAFFFCPGVAEILVRLWSPPPDAIRRVLKEAGAMERDHDPSYAVDVLSRNFPAHLRPLTTTSFASLMRYLRSKPRDSIPLSSAYIPWNGPWVGRWAGRDSDLFFVFTKTAVSIISELLPENISQADWVCVPCAALIQAQLLTVMDATMHRGSSHHSHQNQHDANDGLPPPSFDDVLGADAVVQTLPPRAPNTTRIMAENRLVMLLRECLFSQSYVVKAHTRRTFAHIYGNLIKASTRRVSLYDHNSCFTLCDFLDEAINILSRFYKDEVDPAGWIDWPFWFDVLRKMSTSNNTMTEVRLYSFVYGMWTFLTKDEGRKREICLDWLLEESYFDRMFNHWCPMVRAYYMRLLCWRIGREDGDGNETNILIYETLLQRLQKAFAWFQGLHEMARADGKVPPSSAPATPAPGKRLLIVRSDSLPGNRSNGAWDGITASSSSQPNTYQRYTSLNPVLQQAPEKPEDNKASSTPEPAAAKKGWFRKINPFAAVAAVAAAPTPAPGSPSPESDAESFASTRSDAKSSEASTLSSKRMSTMSSASSFMSESARAPDTPTKRPQATASFKFSLEWADKSFLHPRNRKIHAPQLPPLAQILLDSRAETKEGKDGEEQGGEARKARTVVMPLRPTPRELAAATYCGRALAEWEMLMRECQGFYERRRKEGVKEVRWMEIPTLSVESFRRPVG